MQPQAREVTDKHYAAQAAVGAALVKSIEPPFSEIDLTDLTGAIPKFVKKITPLVQHHGRASRGLSTRYYARMRQIEGIEGRFIPHLAGLPDATHVGKVVDWSTRNLWADKGGALPDVETRTGALVKTAGGLQKATLDVGRSQVVDAATEDLRARAWAREARPDSCWFCAMLAIRGAVYGSLGAAGADANKDFQGTGSFKFHDHCHCQVIPVFGEYEAPAHVRGWQAIYESSTGDVSGMKAKQRAFRAALLASRRTQT